MSITSPDTRITTYNPVVPTTEFAAQFPVFDNDDIKVFINGEPRGDFAVTATYVEGIANDAKAVFAVGVTGQVIVVGARAPRRTSRFNNGGPLPTRDQNLALDTVEAESQEQGRDIARALKAKFGDAPQDLPSPDGVSLLGWSAENKLVNRQGEGESAAAAEDAADRAEAAAAGVNLPAAIADTMLIQKSDASGYLAKTADEVRQFLEVMRLTAPVQQRILRFDKYRSIYATDQEAFEAIVRDAFSTTAIDTYGAFIDGCGFVVTLKPCDISAVTGRTSNFKTVTFSNFTFLADTSGTTDWDRKVANVQGSIVQFSNVMTVTTTANLEVGMCVLDTTENPIVPGAGIARETYITEIVDATTIKLNTIANRTRTKFWNFVKFPYFMTFRGLTTASRIKFKDINFRCQDVASCVQMGGSGNDWMFFNIHALNVKDRLITDFSDNSNGCHFMNITAWASDNSATRTCYGITVSSNDAKFTNLRVINFLASQIMHGSGYTVVGCHSWQGGTTVFKRQAAFVHTNPKPFVTYSGCYIDNGGIEFSNENADNPNLAFNLITITGCEFTFNSMADTTSRYITLTLVGYDGDTSLKGIDGFKLTGCTFRKFVNTTGNIPNPAEVIVVGTGGLNPDAINNLVWDACYLNVVQQPQNPCRVAQTQTTAVDTWNFAFANKLPFGLKPKSVLGTQIGGLAGMKNAADALQYVPYTTYLAGVDTTVVCRFASAVKGTVTMTVDACANT